MEEKLFTDLPLDFGRNKHDRFFRYAMQHKEIALALIQFALPAHLLEILDFSTLEHSEESFLDDSLRQHFTDICYTCFTKDQAPIRLTIIIEHKSRKPPKRAIIEQLHRYIGNIWAMDIRQNWVLSVPLPIVVHQGKTKFQYESTSEYFAHVPEQLKQYIPQVEYVVLDLSQFDYQQLSQISNWLLYHFLMTLKGGKDNVFLEQHSEEIIIFAPEYANIPLYIRIYTMSIVYLTNTSKKFNKKVQSMGTQEITTPYIKKLKRSQSFIVQLIAENLEKGIEKGIEKGVEKAVITFLEKSPETPDTQVAHLFDISVETVQQLRASITKG